MKSGRTKWFADKRPAEKRFIITALLPIVILYLILRVIPILMTFYLSVHEWNIISPRKPFVWFQNYVSLIDDPDFLVSLKNTLLFCVGYTIPCILLALGLALALNSKRVKGASVLQAAFFVPYVVSMVPVSIVWKWIYDPTLGILNYILSLFGAGPRGWLVEPRLSLFSIILMTIWKTVGYYLILFLVGLKNIPNEYYEAAQMDGANAFHVLKNVTLPLLRPVTLVATVMATINSFTVFTQIYVMTQGSQGAPGNVVRVLVYDIYEKGFRFYQMGLASAEAVVLFFLVFVLMIVQIRVMRSSQEGV